MKEYGTFRVDGETWRIVGAGLAQTNDYYLADGPCSKILIAEYEHIRRPRIIVERVEEEKPVCEHKNAFKTKPAVPMDYQCYDCGYRFWTTTIVAKDSLGILRRWRHLATRTPAFGELVFNTLHSGRNCVALFNGGMASSSDMIVVPADEAT